MVHLYNILHGRNSAQSFVGSTMTVQCHVNNDLQHHNKIMFYRSVLDRKISRQVVTEEQLDVIGPQSCYAWLYGVGWQNVQLILVRSF